MMQRILPSFLLLSFLALSGGPALAQTGDIAGTVTDAESGKVLPGVNVVVQELDRGAATDEEGTYTINEVPPGTYTIRASFVGYSPFETEVSVEAGEFVTLDVEMNPGAVGLDEVVVTGYGTQESVSEITGSIGNIDAEEINDVPVQNAEQLLQGRAAGVTVQSTSGNPGGNFEIDVRGQGSINASDDPLYIVDGIQVSQSEGARNNSTNVLSAINPRDIESIEVLKDAAAASIYGAQGGGGVVLITTKSGREGPVEVSVNYEGGMRFQPDRYDTMGRDDWIDYQIDAFGESTVRDAILADYGYDPEVPFEEVRNFNWQDFIFRRGPSHSAGFSATGGNEDTQFRLSGNWENTMAAAKEVSYTTFGINTNINQRFTSYLDVDLRINLSNQDMPGVCQDGFFVNCPFYQGLAEEPPISHPYLEDGSYNPNTEQAARYNPAITLFEEDRETNITQLIGSINPTLSLAPWLSLRGTLGFDWQRHKETDYESPASRPADGGTIDRTFDEIQNMTANLTLDAQQRFAGAHNVNALLGTEYRREFEDDDSYFFTGFGNQFLRVPSAASSNDGFSGSNTEFRFLSYFGQLNYDYEGRYLVTLSGRYDASSRFGDRDLWGFFPSASVGWRIVEEEFFTVDAVDELKVRASYGVTGNSEIGNFAARGLYSVSGSYNDVVGIGPNQLANQSLTWEESREINLALDWSLWNGRVSGSMDLYRDISDELLLDRPLPRSSGFNDITENVGTVQNRGIDLSLQVVPVQTESIRWSLRGNANLNENTVQELTGDVECLNPGDAIPTCEGSSIRAWEVDKYAGVNPADGRPMYFDEDGNITYFPSEEDEQSFDGGEEDVVGGFGTTVQWEGFTVNAFFDFSYGGTKLPATERTYMSAFGEGVLERANDRWREPGDTDALWVRAEPFNSFDNAQNPNGINSYWLFDNSYIRFKTLSVSYQLPTEALNALGLGGVRIYATGTNLVTWTSYLGLDPEVAGTEEEASFPDESQLNLGIEIDL